jgi:hypothetical protein
MRRRPKRVGTVVDAAHNGEAQRVLGVADQVDLLRNKFVWIFMSSWSILSSAFTSTTPTNCGSPKARSAAYGSFCGCGAVDVDDANAVAVAAVVAAAAVVVGVGVVVMAGSEENEVFVSWEGVVGRWDWE